MFCHASFRQPIPANRTKHGNVFTDITCGSAIFVEVAHCSQLWLLLASPAHLMDKFYSAVYFLPAIIAGLRQDSILQTCRPSAMSLKSAFIQPNLCAVIDAFKDQLKYFVFVCGRHINDVLYQYGFFHGFACPVKTILFQMILMIE